MIRKEKRLKITEQAKQEIAFARQFKAGKIRNWQKNEDLYYGKKVQPDSSRANVDLGRMQEFVHTLLSKIDNPLIFKFVKRKDAQLKRAQRLNALRQIDSHKNDWDMKDIVGKKQAILYGRAIYSYHADSHEGYKSHLENIDVYDFLVDPSAGGIDLERAYFLGRYGIVKNKSDLEAGKKAGLYLKNETQALIDGAGNANEKTQEEENKRNRTYSTEVWTTEKEKQGTDKYVFWEWYTTFEGERYYLLMQERGEAIRVEKLSDMFESNLYPFWSWAAFPDLSEFWTPSFADYVREIFMAQAVSINQMIDNSEQINKPQKAVNVGAIKNLAELKYKKDGYIKINKDFDVNKAIQTLRVPQIDTPIKVYELLEGIQEKSSGVTAGAKGIAGEDKVGIYEGNQANAADRFGYLNKSYAFGYKKFAQLYEHGVREHLSKKVAITILGPDGTDIETVSKRDIFRKGEEFDVMIESSNAELSLGEMEKRTKIAFLSQQAKNQIINPKKAFEVQAQIAGFTEDEIRQLLDTSDFGSAELMSEAERDIELILDGKNIEPNARATTAYKQRFVDYMMDKKEDITDEQFDRLAMYVISLDEIIVTNTIRMANDKLMKQQLDQMAQGQQQAPQGAGGSTQPLDEEVMNPDESQSLSALEMPNQI